MKGSESTDISYKNLENFKIILGTNNATSRATANTLKISKKNKSRKSCFRTFLISLGVIILLTGGLCWSLKQVFYPDKTVLEIMNLVQEKTMAPTSNLSTNTLSNEQESNHDEENGTVHRLEPMQRYARSNLNVTYPTESPNGERKKRNISNETSSFANPTIPDPDIYADFINLSSLHEKYNLAFDKFSNFFRRAQTSSNSVRTEQARNAEKDPSINGVLNKTPFTTDDTEHAVVDYSGKESSITPSSQANIASTKGKDQVSETERGTEENETSLNSENGKVSTNNTANNMEDSAQSITTPVNQLLANSTEKATEAEPKTQTTSTDNDNFRASTNAGNLSSIEVPVNASNKGPANSDQIQVATEKHLSTTEEVKSSSKSVNSTVESQLPTSPRSPNDESALNVDSAGASTTETEDDLADIMTKIAIMISKNDSASKSVVHDIAVQLHKHTSKKGNESGHVNPVGKRSLKNLPSPDSNYKIRCYETITYSNGKTITQIINLPDFMRKSANQDSKTRFPRSDYDELPPFSAHSLSTHKLYAGYFAGNTTYVANPQINSIGTVDASKPNINVTVNNTINYCTHVPHRDPVSKEDKNDTSTRKIITLEDIANLSFSELENELCVDNEKLCSDKSQCIKSAAWCDGITNCMDKSDEVNCSCKERMDKEKLCDGYFDCPDGEDEEGCFGCSANSFSCEDWAWAKWKPNTTCVPISKRCDGISDCHNHKDENECVLLADKIYSHETFFVSYTSGYLHHNWKGKWYPACVNNYVTDWAKRACESELGVRVRNVEIEERTFQTAYNGAFITVTGAGIELVETCDNKKNSAIFVTCPPEPCGSRIRYNTDLLKYRYRRFTNETSDNETNFEKLQGTSDETIETLVQFLRRLRQTRHQRSITSLEEIDEDLSNSFARKRREEDERVVGGHVSGPGSWPWLVALYKNGIFHCGGVILDESWIMTAAHCVQKYQRNFFEVQAGILRRLSFSPMEQIRTVSHVITHEEYSRTDMSNDLALMKVDTPFKLNRWVRPICLPEGRPPWGPTPGLKCTAVGWGATEEHGPDPDNMREVEVPILSECKHSADKEGNEICAGYLYGGHDTCQGDSGGPLLCRTPIPQDRWYVAGIVSHGEGCARPMEPGVYTRVALYLPWLLENADDSKLLSKNKPPQKCPGMKCKDGSRCIAQRKICDDVIDCLDAEDELNCVNWKYQYTQSQLQSGHSPFKRQNFNKYNAESEYGYTVSDDYASIDNVQFVGLDDIKRKGKKEREIKNQKPTEKGPLKTVIVNSANLTSENVFVMELMKKIHIIYSEDVNVGENFVCKIIEQVIPVNWYCDGEVDCEDGTDEINCTCADVLGLQNKSLICNGVIDCYNVEDEINCTNNNCSESEYYCFQSAGCINRTQVCDGKSNCPEGEDEKHCYGLKNDQNLLFDIFGTPLPTEAGTIMKNTNGIWNPLCLNSEEIFQEKIHKICNSLGYVGVKHFEKVKIQQMTKNMTTLSRCYSIDAVCQSVRYDDSVTIPWHTNIYFNGELQCTGLLLNSKWIIAHPNCYQFYRSKVDVAIVAVLGGSKISGKIIQGYGEQTMLVNLITHDEEQNVTLLRLVHPFNITKHVKSLKLSLWAPSQDTEDKCILVGSNQINSAISFRLRSTDCKTKVRCYKPENKTELCSYVNNGATFSGVVCSLHNAEWYLSAFVVSQLSSYCASGAERLQLPIWHNPNFSSYKMLENPLPKCEGVRCELGKCIPWSSVCDGKPECRRNEDEDAIQCAKKKTFHKMKPFEYACRGYEFQCSNRKCVSLSNYCNDVNDCGDGSDEPSECSTFNCAKYLKLTNPGKLCDSRRDCDDKSDENLTTCPSYCNSSSHFVCSQSKMCIPLDFVCDGEIDCPNQEDEFDCWQLNTKNKSTNEPTLKIRSNGVWQYECISPDFTDFTAEVVCKHFGYQNVTQLEYIPASKTITSEYTIVKLNNLKEFRIRNKVNLLRVTEICNNVHLTCK